MKLNYFEDDKMAQEFVEQYLKLDDQQYKLDKILEVVETTTKLGKSDSYFYKALITIKGIIING